MGTIKKILKPLASLYLTVPLLLLSMLLIYAGTTVQKEMGIQDVQKQFFHSWFARAPLDPMLRPFAQSSAQGGSSGIPGAIWIPGGFTLIALLLANLLAAHSVRFKLTLKRSGIIAVHLGLILLLVGEVFASLWSVESQMMIDSGQTVNYAYDLRHVELAVSDTSAPDHDHVTTIDSSLLKPDAVIHAPGLPFDIKVENYFPNSMVLGPMQQAADAVQKATSGANVKIRVAPEPKVSGIEGKEYDLASAFVTLSSGGKSLGTFLVSQYASQTDMVQPETVNVEGRRYKIDLRFRRYYKPYTLTLLKFSHDRYPGTDVPYNFSSRVRLIDPEHHVDRVVLIWMNHPLSYRGDTYYQQSFLPNDRTTILQVAHQPSWVLPGFGWAIGTQDLPYLGLAFGLAGLVFHFGMHLRSFLRRTRAEALERARSSRDPSNYTLEPESKLLPRLYTFIGAAACLAIIGVQFSSSPPPSNGFDLGTFAKLPVLYGGRAMPLDSLARDTLRVISNRESFKDEHGDSQPAIRWLIDVMSDAPASSDYKVIRIDHPDILAQLGLDPYQKYFSLNDLLAHKDVVQKQFDLTFRVPEKQRDLYQNRMVDLANHIELYLDTQQKTKLLLVPPSREDGDWKPLLSNGKLSFGAAEFVTLLQDYRENLPGDFNSAVTAYHDQLVRRLPRTMARVDFETFFDRVSPFFLCMWFYVSVFVLVCISWVALPEKYRSRAIGILGVTLLLHTFGLVARIYMTGRPPVTNLYSSAIFIAWAAAVLSFVLELIHRNGLGAAVAAVVGFCSLLIAYYLGSDGDTMKPVQAVLATNFWLWTHVPCVTLGYSATLLAGILGIAYILLGISTPWVDEQVGKTLARMVYGIVCFAIIFSFVGTILGGIWADYSWGRFWGWDPKENGAILIVLWNAVILHARWAGIVRQRGMMVLAVIGNIVTAWSWFGTNLLGIGLHSYGFMEGAATWLTVAVFAHVALVAVGLLPLHWWRSFAESRPGGGFPVMPRNGGDFRL